MTIDDRIKNDLEDLYNSGILAYIQQFKGCKINEAEQLSTALFGNSDEFSTHGLPGYYVGNRDAKTVMVMLNPGSDVISQNNPFVTERTLNKLKINTDTHDEFVKSFKKGSQNFGDLDIVDEGKDKGKIRLDNFDIKQAAFLKAWESRGFEIQDPFPTKDEKDGLRIVKKDVLMNKLQLELIPYASREFKSVKDDKMPSLFPYVETLFEEIFRCERKYVIFCSDFFERLFRMYSDDMNYSGSIVLGGKEEMVLFQKENKKERKAYCTPITIKYFGKAMSSIDAVIAHTFPNKSLPNAYDKMQEYGKFCFDVFMKWEKHH
jgi:hypothetical protein